MNESTNGAAGVNNLEDALAWISAKSESGEIPHNTARFSVTAITQLAGMLRDDEPRTGEYFLENADDLARRWANVHRNRKGDTGQAYLGGARRAVEQYLAWKSDPGAFRFPVREVKRAPESKPKTKPKAKPSATPEPEAPPTSNAAPVGTAVRVFPLGNGRAISWSGPDDLVAAEAYRYLCHVLTLCVDFDPTKPPGSGPASPPTWFGLARRDPAANE